MRNRYRILSAKVAIGLVLASTVLTPPAGAIPVFDASNLAQNVLSVARQTAMVAKQIQQYQLQILEYQNMVRNTVAPAAYIWSEAQAAINGLRSSVDQLESLKRQAGGLSRLLDQYQNVAYYKASPCFTSAGCTRAERAALNSAIEAKQATMLASSKSVLRGLDDQQAQLSADANQLETIQAAAQTAGGQLEALGYANQLAGSAANQLVQLRGLMLAQQAAAAAQAQAESDRQAMLAAARAQARRSEYNPSAPGIYQWTD